MCLVVGMQVIGVPGNLEFSEDLWGFRICQVDDEEGVHLFKGDQIAFVTHKSGGVEVFTGRYSLEDSDDV